MLIYIFIYQAFSLSRLQYRIRIWSHVFLYLVAKTDPRSILWCTRLFLYLLRIVCNVYSEKNNNCLSHQADPHRIYYWLLLYKENQIILSKFLRKKNHVINDLSIFFIDFPLKVSKNRFFFNRRKISLDICWRFF